MHRDRNNDLVRRSGCTGTGSTGIAIAETVWIEARLDPFPLGTAVLEPDLDLHQEGKEN